MITGIDIVQRVVRDKRGRRVCGGLDESTAAQSKVERIIATEKDCGERELGTERPAWGIRVPKIRILRQIHFPYPINHLFRAGDFATAFDFV